MDPYEETFETWNDVADLYQEVFMDLALYNESYDYICHAIPFSGARLLDVGCGPGNISKYLLSNRPDFQILGIDVAPRMVELAAWNNPSAEFEVKDVRRIDELDSKFEGIICGFCLPYLSPEEAEKLISDSYDQLEPHGILYLSFVPGNPESSGFQTGSTGRRVYFHFHPSEDVLHWLEDNQFTLLQSFNVEYKKSDSATETHTILVARK